MNYYSKQTQTNPIYGEQKNKPKQTQFMVSKVEPPVVSLPALFTLSAIEGSIVEGSNLFQNGVSHA